MTRSRTADGHGDFLAPSGLAQALNLALDRIPRRLATDVTCACPDPILRSRQLSYAISL